MQKNNSSSPLLSIVIPTKNRYHTLNEVVQAIVNMPDPDFEVIVQDCSDGIDDFELIAKKFSDPRVRFYKSPSNISMTENWNHAFHHIRGEYVIYIGDDDLVGSNIMDVARWAHANDIDAVSGTISGTAYFWPDYPISSESKTLKIKRCQGAIEHLNSLQEATIGSFGIGTENFGRLPQVYHGLVKVTSLRKMPNLSGNYFDGIAPDYYASYALALTVKKFCLIDYSFTIVGASKNSNTARSAVQNLVIYQHWNEYDLKSWPEFIPLIKINYTLIAESMVKAFLNSNRADLAMNINIWKLYSLCILRSPRNFFWILSRVRISAGLLGHSILNAYFGISGNIIKKINHKLFRSSLKRKSETTFSNVSSILEAHQIHKHHFPNIAKMLNKEPAA